MRNDKNKEKILSFLGWSILCLLLINLLYFFIPRSPPSSIPKQISSFEQQKPVHEGHEALSLQTLSNPLQLVVFFASWCSMCAVEHPYIVSLKKNYPDLQIHGVTVNDSAYATLHFLEKYQNPYDTLSIASLDMMRNFKVMGIPQTFLINDQKEILYHKRGVLSQRDIDQNIVPSLEKSQIGK